MKQTNIVVVGGGTGTSVVISGLKQKPVEITALVSVADSGGSTGRLRDEFGFQPVGDLRQSLAALALADRGDWIRKLLLYRFEKGKGLKGHNLGNLLLTALQDIAGSTVSALEIAEQIFRLHGKIYPITTQNIQLVVEYSDGTVSIGEHLLDNPQAGNKKIARIRLSPRAKLYTKAKTALLEADVIVLGPGDFYSSIIAALSVQDMKKTLRQTKAKIVYILNLMTRFTQTHNMKASDHIAGIEKIIGRRCDAFIINSKKVSKEFANFYAKEQEYQIIDDIQDSRCVRADLLSKVSFTPTVSDTAYRSFLRHDSKKLAEVLWRMV